MHSSPILIIISWDKHWFFSVEKFVKKCEVDYVFSQSSQQVRTFNFTVYGQ